MILLFILILLGIYVAYALKINLGRTVYSTLGYPMVTVFRYIIAPVGLVNLIISIFLPSGTPRSLRILGIITGILGVLLGVFFWLLIIAAAAGVFG